MASRWRREDYDKVKHDKCFTDWKVLVGPSDWREGGERFWALNLPGPHAGSGVYELGVTLPAWKTVDHYSESASLKSEDIVVVYVGHAEHIRKRLQRYGQAGACLEGSRSTRPPPVNKFPELNFGRFADSTQSSSNGEELQGKYGQDRPSSRMIGGRRGSRVDMMQVSIPQSRIPQSRSPVAQPVTSPRGPRLFSEVFALGCSVAFRWASTRSKEVAEYVVHDLTDVFDYAWNRGGGNSVIRSQDIVGKIVLGKRAPDTSCCTSTGSRWSGMFPFTRKPEIGIKIAAHKPKSNPSPHTKSSSTSPCKALFTLLREKPHLMLIPGKSSTKFTKHSEFTKINIPVNRCGSFLPSGLVCNALPQQGRTRCPIHDSSSSSTRRNASQVASFDHSLKLITSRISIPKPPLSSCFPLRFQKKPQQQSEVKQRGSISFSTWLSRSVEIKNKSIEWLLAMEEIKRRSYDCTSTSPIFKPESPSPGILTLSDGADIPEIIEELRHCPELGAGLSSTGHRIPSLDTGHCIPLLDIEHCKTVYTVHCKVGDAGHCPREDTGHCSISGTGHCKMGGTGHSKMGDTGHCKMLDTGCCRMGNTGHCMMGDTGRCKMVDTGMPYSIVPKGSPVRWPPTRSDAYATRYVPPQYFL